MILAVLSDFILILFTQYICKQVKLSSVDKQSTNHTDDYYYYYWIVVTMGNGGLNYAVVWDVCYELCWARFASWVKRTTGASLLNRTFYGFLLRISGCFYDVHTTRMISILFPIFLCCWCSAVKFTWQFYRRISRCFSRSKLDCLAHRNVICNEGHEAVNRIHITFWFHGTVICCYMFE